MPEAGTILIVDDDPVNVDLLEQILVAAGYRTATALSGKEALAAVVTALPDLVLLDAMMRDMDGYETCGHLKTSEITRPIPVIFLTALTDTFDKVRAFRAGAVDYVTKPFEPDELLARVGTHIALRREVEAHRRSKATIAALVEQERRTGGTLVGASPGLARVRELVAQVASTDSTVLIQGETGTGKEVVARAIYGASGRRDRPLVKLNCAALPRELVESELFGHEKGAFTGAVQQRRGRFELADGGTLFLDEVGELPLEAQAKLLRVLQEREFERVGGTRSLHVDVRVIAATNRDLPGEVAGARFRADLFYRLNVFPIALPALRDRRVDIPALLRHTAALTSRRLGRAFEGISPSFEQRALSYDWPGNIRELENVVERALIMSRGGLLDASDFPPPSAGNEPRATPIGGALEEIEREHIRHVLEGVQWQIEGAHGAAHALGLNPSTLRGRMRKLGLHKPS